MCPSKKDLSITMLSNGRAPWHMDGHHYVSVLGGWAFVGEFFWRWSFWLWFFGGDFFWW